MTEHSPDPAPDDGFVIALEPAQLGAVVALIVAVIVLWRVAKKDRVA